MDTEGLLEPETAESARERYQALGSTARTVVREVAKAMEMNGAEYDQRVTADVVATAQDALFASQLNVRVGTRSEYEEWLDTHPEYDVEEVGSEHVDGVVWHAAPVVETVVAATYHDQRQAAVDTLCRQAFGRVYRDLVTNGSGDAPA